MIPFRDRNPSGSTPYVTFVLVAINVVAFFYEAGQPPRQRQAFIARYALFPGRVIAYLEGEPKTGLAATFLPFFTSMFLHGGLVHLLGNMLYLWIFGDNVEDRMGHGSYLAFYLLCGLGAGAAHVGSQAVSSAGVDVPTVGASGAIAGVLGAYLLAFPRAEVATLVPIGFFFAVVHLPAVVVLGFWFLLQYLGGLQSLRMPQMGGVAWWAHIGGFVLGMVLLGVFQKPKSQRRQYVRYR
ncbi:MAG: rhomboid family intramembrane serine protease [Candidatus Brocadiia bacterium]